MFFKDENLRSLKLSRNFETMLGKPLAELLNINTNDLFPPDLAKSINEADRRILHEGKPIDLEEEFNDRIYQTIKFPIERRGKPSYLAGFMIDITESKRSEQRILQSLREKETLIRELYHRTKNTLQIIGSMLLLQADEHQGNEELQQLVRNTENRIQAIALVHQMLYQSQDLSQISIKAYLAELAALIYQSYEIPAERIHLDLKIGEQNFLLDTAIPVGLIVNELMTNSFKYAFPDDGRGSIGIEMREEESDWLVLTYSDDGIGVPPEYDFRNQNSLGMKLIYSIGEQQLQGHVEMKSDHGITCSVEFKNNLYVKRV
jgi:PAS domain S-box-containing protein